MTVAKEGFVPVTTTVTVVPGQTFDKDFGAGDKYSLILEQTRIERHSSSDVAPIAQ